MEVVKGRLGYEEDWYISQKIANEITKQETEMVNFVQRVWDHKVRSTNNGFWRFQLWAPLLLLLEAYAKRLLFVRLYTLSTQPQALYAYTH